VQSVPEASSSLSFLRFFFSPQSQNRIKNMGAPCCIAKSISAKLLMKFRIAR
jgi:hypothetical protein